MCEVTSYSCAGTRVEVVSQDVSVSENWFPIFVKS